MATQIVQKALVLLFAFGASALLADTCSATPPIFPPATTVTYVKGVPAGRWTPVTVTVVGATGQDNLRVKAYTAAFSPAGRKLTQFGNTLTLNPTYAPPPSYTYSGHAGIAALPTGWGSFELQTEFETLVGWQVISEQIIVP